MNYTSLAHLGAVTVQSIVPVDARMVTVAISVKIHGYMESMSDELLLAYTHLALSGTNEKDEESIDAHLRSNGIVLSVSTDLGFVHYKLTTEASLLKKGLSMVHELIHKSVFPHAHVKRTIALMLEENREAHDDAKRRAEADFINTLYAYDSYVRYHTLAEEREEITKVSRQRLLNLLLNIREGEWYISVVGNEVALREVKAFAKQAGKHSTKVERDELEYAHIQSAHTFTTITGKTNVEVRIGNRLPITFLEKEYVPLSFGLTVLGKMGGFSGRLMSIVREKEGLTYGIYTKMSAPDITSLGHWNIFTFFTGKDLAQGLTSTLREIKKIVTKGITDRELVVFKEILDNQFLIAHESNRQRLALYHSVVLQGGTELLITENRMRTQKLTKHEVNEALKKFINSNNLAVTGAGPVTEEGIGIVS